MKTTIDYSNRETKNFDAIEDIKNYLGMDRWDKIYPIMSQVSSVKQFDIYCGFMGIEASRPN